MKTKPFSVNAVSPLQATDTLNILGGKNAGLPSHNNHFNIISRIDTIH